MKIAYVYDAVYLWIKGGGAEKRIYEISWELLFSRKGIFGKVVERISLYCCVTKCFMRYNEDARRDVERIGDVG